MSKVVAIHQPQYLSYPGFFHKILHCDIFVILDDVQFQKNGFQNRNRIKTQHGELWLTIPVIREFGQYISDVSISDPRWQRKHWFSLKTSYARAPFFKEYSESLEALYMRHEYTKLCEVNSIFTNWVLCQLGINTPVVYSSAIEKEGIKSDRLVDICKSLDASHYLAGPGSHAYIDLDVFRRENISVEFQNFNSLYYEQLYPELGFIPNLSIIDALLNCGPQLCALFQSS